MDDPIISGSKASASGANPLPEQAAAKSAKARPADAAAWRELLDLDLRLSDQKNIRLLTPEARVLIHLKLNGPVSVTTAMQVARTSYRGFYAVLERLKQAGVIATVKDDNDQRVRKLSIDPSVSIPSVRR